jgi:SSS family solute:Na+ symporter
VTVSRITTVLIMIFSVAVTGMIERISGAWEFIIECGAGLGLVLILRWYWWRINAWSEITAMIAPFLAYSYIRFATPIRFPDSLYYIVGFTTAAWLAATFLTRPTEMEHLKDFYRRVHPGGALWKPVADLVPEVRGTSGLGHLALDWLAGIVLVFSILFGLGSLIFGFTLRGVLFLFAGAGAAAYLYWDLSRTGWSEVSR